MRKPTLVLAPFSVARGLVVNASEEMEVLEWNLLLLNAKLLVELSLRSPLDARNCIWEVGSSLARDSQGVGAAGIGPEIRESNLLSRPLLQKQLVLFVEEEDGERTVEEPLINIGHEVAYRAIY
jgi:hypothetical protein